MTIVGACNIKAVFFKTNPVTRKDLHGNADCISMFFAFEGDMKRAKSISIAELAVNVKAAISEVHKENPALFEIEPEISFIPNPGIIGFVIRESEVKGRVLGDVANIAKLVGKKLKPVSGVKTMDLLIRDGNVIVGFFPTNEAVTL
ncbi:MULTISPECIES: hypothetical protein [Rhizobium/Agrobacterium group]|uniref:hypothetical protein n=1 Tax=Rhizobium/Agrobacterium group TaxID=227290 RepID=UPI00115FED34|nr:MULTISPECIES: hypothetical protein [Rhizobium/Agrobacterium group]MCF1464758.1 hypothetical protein [Allorhizobium ampelinum]MCF1495304.1 hypothetical protein [Allorhizobium ampelinum]MUZ55361.1 hypothetical protein [Agrobacterium vitis]MUZ94628.1 hypothetical protein [Agrobacterium vitis]MVA43184.1 hypothetical protein [Agrobacterium vitis]